MKHPKSHRNTKTTVSHRCIKRSFFMSQFFKIRYQTIPCRPSKAGCVVEEMGPDFFYIPVVTVFLLPKVAIPARFQLVCLADALFPGGGVIGSRIEKAIIRGTGAKSFAATIKIHNTVVITIYILNAGDFFHHGVVLLLDRSAKQVLVLLKKGNNARLLGQFPRKLTGGEQCQRKQKKKQYDRCFFRKDTIALTSL